MKERILVVDDEARARTVLADILVSGGYEAGQAENGAEALRAVSENRPDLVLLDVMLPDMNGIDVLKELAKLAPALPVIMISGFGTIQDAIRATRLGALDFLEKPAERERILLAVGNALERERMRREVALLKEEALRKYRMVGVSAALQGVFQRIDEVAGTRATVLITGENGTGKDLVARAIHAKSGRRDRPFVKLNCAAIPETLIESELFGHEKGSFTGALAQKKGKLEIAHRGTLFMDEVGDLSPAGQAKLLRVLQDRVFERVGGTEEIEVDVRILSATNKDLKREIEQSRFREDLYYRINVIQIHVPSLRERRGDIPVLADFFMEQQCEENGVSRKRFSDRAVDYLQSLAWPGNVRELENLVKRAAILVKAEEIMPHDLAGLLEPDSGKLRIRKQTLRDARHEFEREFVRQTLAANDGDKTRTAEQLDIERTHLYRKMRELGLPL